MNDATAVPKLTARSKRQSRDWVLGTGDWGEPLDEASGSAEAICEVEKPERSTRIVRAQAQGARTHQWKGRAEENGLRQDQQAGKRPFDDGDAGTAGERREDVLVGERGDAAVD